MSAETGQDPLVKWVMLDQPTLTPEEAQLVAVEWRRMHVHGLAALSELAGKVLEVMGAARPVRTARFELAILVLFEGLKKDGAENPAARFVVSSPSIEQRLRVVMSGDDGALFYEFVNELNGFAAP